jgi:16S rRNA processing protein RimM
LTTDRLERVRPGAELFAGERRLVVEASRSHRDSHIVRFAGVVGRDAAEAMRGEVLSAEPLDAPGVLWVHELIGASVVDRAGSPLGTVGAVEANPASDLLVLEGGGLIPLAFVVAGPDEGVVVVDPPPGLLDA